MAFPFTHANRRPPIVRRRRCLPAVPLIAFDGRQFSDTEAIDCRRLGQLLRHGRCCFVLLLFVVRRSAALQKKGNYFGGATVRK